MLDAIHRRTYSVLSISVSLSIGSSQTQLINCKAKGKGKHRMPQANLLVLSSHVDLVPEMCFERLNLL